MQKCWGQCFAFSVVALLLALSTAANAAEMSGSKTAAEQLTERTKTPAADAENGDDKGISDSAVRVMLGYAWSILPSTMQGPDGTTIALDKSSPKQFLIPIPDAREVIRAAMRSAYAQICDLPKLEQANYATLMQGEENRKIWTLNQMQMITALHMFSVSYFTGDLKITEKAAKDQKGDRAADKADSKGDAAFDPKRPKCTPEKKAAVTKAIEAYVKSAQASEPAEAAQASQAAQAASPAQAAQTVQPTIATPIAPSTAKSVTGSN
jgi:hypothetical protein